MSEFGKQKVSKWVILHEASAFGAIILFIWLDEILDIPHLLFGAEKTPVNWRESLFESLVILIFGAMIIHFTKKMFERMKTLEGILPVCASCKKIRDEQNNWHAIESYIHERSDAQFSHGICPDCAAKLYPDFNPYKKKK